MVFPNPIKEPLKCFVCDEPLTKENYSGWFDFHENDLGIVVKVPICNECNLHDDGSDKNGAY